MVEEPNAVYPCSRATLLRPSTIIPLQTTTSGTHTGSQPIAQKVIQYTFSTTLSPRISRTAPNFEDSLNFLAK